jgi:hypothetical protein
MKSKQEPTPTAETPWQPLSQEQRTSGAEWLERTKADLRPASQEPQTRRVMKAYLEAPIETRHLAARKAATDYESERREADMDSRRRYNSGVAALCGLLGGIILPILIGREWFLDDRWLAVLCIVGLPFGWVLGAAYIYPRFYYENGTAKPHTVRIQATVQKWRQRMCATGLHSWEKWIHTKTCRVCGKRQVI